MPMQNGRVTFTNGIFTGVGIWGEYEERPNLPLTGEALDAKDADLANILEGLVARDGQNSPTQNLPMDGRKHLNVADATERNEYATLGQLQGRIEFIPASRVAGTADAITIDTEPSYSELTIGQVLRFFVEQANTGAVSLNVNNIGARPLQSADGKRLAANTLLPDHQIEAIFTGVAWRLAGGFSSAPGPAADQRVTREVVLADAEEDTFDFHNHKPYYIEEEVIHEATKKRGSFEDYAGNNYLGSFRDDPSGGSYTAGFSWYFDWPLHIPIRYESRVVDGRQITDWFDSDIPTVLPGFVYIGNFYSDEIALAHTNQLNTVYLNDRTNTLRRCNSFTAGTGETKAKARVRLLDTKDAQVFHDGIEANRKLLTDNAKIREFLPQHVAGTVNAIVLTSPASKTKLLQYDETIISFITEGVPTTAATTVKVDALAAIPLRREDGNRDLRGIIKSGQRIMAVFNPVANAFDIIGAREDKTTTGGTGLDQAAVDARITTLVPVWARDAVTKIAETKLYQATASRFGTVKAATNALVDTITGSPAGTILGWSVPHIRRAIVAMVPSWARDKTIDRIVPFSFISIEPSGIPDSSFPKVIEFVLSEIQTTKTLRNASITIGSITRLITTFTRISGNGALLQFTLLDSELATIRNGIKANDIFVNVPLTLTFTDNSSYVHPAVIVVNNPGFAIPTTPIDADIAPYSHISIVPEGVSGTDLPSKIYVVLGDKQTKKTLKTVTLAIQGQTPIATNITPTAGGGDVIIFTLSATVIRAIANNLRSTDQVVEAPLTLTFTDESTVVHPSVILVNNPTFAEADATSGLTQAQVDARITTLVPSWSRDRAVSRIVPYSQLLVEPAGIPGRRLPNRLDFVLSDKQTTRDVMSASISIGGVTKNNANRTTLLAGGGVLFSFDLTDANLDTIEASLSSSSSRVDCPLTLYFDSARSVQFVHAATILVNNPGFAGAGLTQAQVDARVKAGILSDVPAWARDLTTKIPEDKPYRASSTRYGTVQAGTNALIDAISLAGIPSPSIRGWSVAHLKRGISSMITSLVPAWARVSTVSQVVPFSSVTVEPAGISGKVLPSKIEVFLVGKQTAQVVAGTPRLVLGNTVTISGVLNEITGGGQRLEFDLTQANIDRIESLLTDDSEHLNMTVRVPFSGGGSFTYPIAILVNEPELASGGLNKIEVDARVTAGIKSDVPAWARDTTVSKVAPFSHIQVSPVGIPNRDLPATIAFILGDKQTTKVLKEATLTIGGIAKTPVAISPTPGGGDRIEFSFGLAERNRIANNLNSTDKHAAAPLVLTFTDESTYTHPSIILVNNPLFATGGLNQDQVDARAKAVAAVTPGPELIVANIASYDKDQNRFEDSSGKEVTIPNGASVFLTQAVYDAAVADAGFTPNANATFFTRA